MHDIAAVILKYHLEEDLEHIIIPLHRGGACGERVFLLKRRFIRVVHPDERFEDYPIHEVVEAIVTHPGLSLSESIQLVHQEPEGPEEDTAEDAGKGDSDEEKDSDQREVP